MKTQIQHNQIEVHLKAQLWDQVDISLIDQIRSLLVNRALDHLRAQLWDYFANQLKTQPCVEKRNE